MKVEEVEPGTLVRFKSGKVAVVGNKECRTKTFTRGFVNMEDYNKQQNIGSIRLDAEVEIVYDN